MLTAATAPRAMSALRVSANRLVDNPPAITAGPFLAAGTWPVLPTSAESAFELDVNYDVLWTFSDDFASCSGACTHVAEYQVVGDSSWTAASRYGQCCQGGVGLRCRLRACRTQHVCLPVCGNRLRFTDHAVGNVLFQGSSTVMPRR